MEYNPLFLPSYLHINGFIHRDVKTPNLLVDDDGTVLLGDLGVAVALHDNEQSPVRGSDRSSTRHTFNNSKSPALAKAANLRKRKSFVGTVSVGYCHLCFITYSSAAMLDGPRSYITEKLRFKG